MIVSPCFIAVTGVVRKTRTTGYDNAAGVATNAACTAITSTLGYPTSKLVEASPDIAAVSDMVAGTLEPISNALCGFMASALWQSAGPIITAIGKALTSAEEFLAQVIRACIPWICFTTRSYRARIGYPCGVRWCKKWWGGYPCGVKWCYGYVTFYYPYAYTCQQCVQFSVLDIINGVMSVVSLLESLIESLLLGLLEALGIEFPTFDLPGVPTQEELESAAQELTETIEKSIPDEVLTAAAAVSSATELAKEYTCTA